MLVNKKQIKQNNLSAYIKSLNDDQKIKLWIKTLLSVHSNLPEIIKSVDKIIEINASSNKKHAKKIKIAKTIVESIAIVK